MDTKTPGGLVFSAFVHLTDHAGRHHAFSPGDPVPGWARPLIGDHVTQTGATFACDSDAGDDPPDLIAQAPGHAPGDDLAAEPPRQPPTSGPGSNRPAWAQFAAQVGQPVSPAWSRQDIIDALIRHGHLRE